MIMKTTFKIGEQVRFNHAFLKSIQGDYELSLANGIIQSIKPIGSHNNHVKILWNDGFISGALTSNLAHMNCDITE
jgi:hypothetical protein